MFTKQLFYHVTLLIKRMKLYRYLLIAPLAAMAWACSEDDPLPKPTIDFSNVPVEVGVEVMFDNLTTNADHYEWRFGNTGKTSTDVSPKVTFDAPGTMQVVLKAFTKDNQVDSVVRTVTIRQRYLTGYVVNVFPFKNDGVEWDDGEVGDDVYPDILVQLLADNADNLDNAYFDGPYSNVKVTDTPFSGTADTDVILTNEDWGFALFDFDGADINNATNADFTFMTGVGFNPVAIPAIKNADGDAGYISVFFTDSNGNTIDVDLYFELK